MAPSPQHGSFMKKIKYFITLLLIFSIASCWAEKATYKDIEQTIGIVPKVLKKYPIESIGGAWSDMKGVQFNTLSEIPNKYKELIGLAVATQIPCGNCVYFHTGLAVANNANQKELNETIAIAALVSRLSLFLDGAQIDEKVFKSEVKKVLKLTDQKQILQAMEEKPLKEETSFNIAQDAYDDMKKDFGLVPSIAMLYPKSSVLGTWKEIKGIYLNPNSTIPPKYKDLIGLAVAAQIHSSYSIYYVTQSAILQGASSEEINEAIAMAGITRLWSTILTGNQIDEKNFTTQADKIAKFLKVKKSKEVGL